MKNITEIINNNHWAILSSPTKYEDGYFTLVGGVVSQLAKICETLTGNDIEAIAIENYLKSKESIWLPIAYGETYIESVTKLDEKLSKLSKDFKWEMSVNNFYFWYENVFDKSPLFSIDNELKLESTPFLISTYDMDGMLPKGKLHIAD